MIGDEDESPIQHDM